MVHAAQISRALTTPLTCGALQSMADQLISFAQYCFIKCIVHIMRARTTVPLDIGERLRIQYEAPAS